MDEPGTSPQWFKTATQIAFVLIAVIVLLVFLNGLVVQPATIRDSPNWSLVSYRDATGVLIPVINSGDITARFGRDGNVTGFSGCNQYLSAYLENGGKIRITYPLHSDLPCPDTGAMQQETEYYGNLAKAETVKTSPSDLTLFDARGNTLLVFQKIKAP